MQSLQIMIVDDLDMWETQYDEDHVMKGEYCSVEIQSINNASVFPYKE